jgi:predicted flap endonuclease-1-like 5' DNA nuclease
MGMNDTSPTSASGMSLLPDSIETLTAIHFTIIGVLALLVIAGLLWGIRAKRSRVKAAREVIAHAEEAGVPPEPIEPAVQEPRAEQFQTQTVAPAPAVVPTPAPVERTPPVQSAPAPMPVAPSLPPIADAPEARVSETSDRLADERIAAASPLEASPATEVAPPPPIETAPIETAPVEARAAAQSYAEGPVTQLKGLGPKVASQLGALGVSTVGQMAALSESEAQGIDAQLGNFTGRMGRDRWIEQARLLAAGDKAGFEAVFGKL